MRRFARFLPLALFLAVPAIVLAQAAAAGAPPADLISQAKALYLLYGPAAFTALYFLAQAIAHIAPTTSTAYKAADWFLTGPARAFVPKAITGGGSVSVPPKTPSAAILFVALCLVLPGAARAQTAPASSTSMSGILSVDAGNFDFHANAVLGSAVGYTVQTGQLAYVPALGFYAGCYKPWKDTCLAVGGGLTLVGGKPNGTASVGILSPPIMDPFAPLSGGPVTFRIGVFYGHNFGGAQTDTITGGLTTQF